MQNKGGLETSSLLQGLFRLNLKSGDVIFERSKVSLPIFLQKSQFSIQDSSTFRRYLRLRRHRDGVTRVTTATNWRHSGWSLTSLCGTRSAKGGAIGGSSSAPGGSPRPRSSPRVGKTKPSWLPWTCKEKIVHLTSSQEIEFPTN